ncbi:MAG TPA: DNA starvation/stationary phase protection protein [Phototrophicaceae bacterium]|nr:DNA starvation/stationary phase protection protein [Phototrophicaceae bacterium]
MTATFIDQFETSLGLSQNQINGIVRVLITTLADEHILYIKLRKYHWNVSGPEFFSLHQLFEKQYNALANIIDEIAERIVQYGVAAPGTMGEFVKEARLKEFEGDVPDAAGMVASIFADHVALVRYLREDVEEVAEDLEDVGAADFLTGLLEHHQQQAWMARAILGGRNRPMQVPPQQIPPLTTPSYPQ